MRLLTLVLVVWCTLAADSVARDIYVNNIFGDDRFNGSASNTSEARTGPYRTITRALKAAQKGDRVIVANTGEAYRESITLQGGRHSGRPQAPFQLIGNGAVLDGTQRVPIHSWSHHKEHVFRYQPPRTAFQVLYLDGKPAQRRKPTKDQKLPDLKPLEWCLLGQHIYFCVEPDRLPQSYDLTYGALRVGITLYEVRYVAVSDLVIQGFQLDGVNAHDGAFHAELVGLNCRGNGRSGISIGGASRVKVQSCLVGNNFVAQVRTEGFSHTQLVHCDLLDNTAPKIVRDGGKVDVTD